MSSLLFPGCKLSRENAQQENTCDIDFEKAQGCGGEVNKTSIMQKQPSEVFFKKGFMRNLAEFTKKASVPETLFR